MLRRPGLTLRLATLLLVGGVAIVVAALVSAESPPRELVRALPPPFTPTPTPAERVEEVLPVSAEASAQPTAEPTPEPTPTAVNTSSITRLVIPSIGVDAPVVVLGVDADGVMQAPGTPTDVGWYDFSGRPGADGNAVFAAHVDYHDYGAAVFWYLRDLVAGDEVIVRLEDGTEYRYAVFSSHYYPFAEAPVQEIVGPTEDQVITLITCAGSFDPSVREYDSRLVVRAQRLPTELAGSP